MARRPASTSLIDQSPIREILDFLEGTETARPERRLEPTARRLVARPSVKPKPVTLQGDVTDEP